MVGMVQWFIEFVVSIVAFIAAAVALVDAMRHPASAYVAAGKQTKVIWGVILGIATLLTFVFLPSPLGRGGGVIGIIGIVAIIATVYYFVDVRKHVSQHRRGPSSGW